MPTLIEGAEPETQEKAKPGECRCAAEWAIEQPVFAEPAMFADVLLDSSAKEKQRKGLATTISVVFQCLLVAGMVIAPLWFTDALPNQQLLTFLVAPPPPPPPPPPAAAVQVVKMVQTDILNNGQLRTPTRIPRKVEMIKEEEAPPPAITGGVVGGVPGGVPGGQLGGVIGSIINASSGSNAIVPKLEAPKRVRISQGVTQGMAISKPEPRYPKIAIAARVTGAVVLKAIIGKDGTIKELEVASGHALLIPAAMDAVKQWRYRPYLLSGEPVEVETTITVNFQMEGQS